MDPTTALFLQACPEDALNALSNELKFTFDGLPSNTQLRPSLAPQAQTTTTYPVSNPENFLTGQLSLVFVKCTHNQ